MQLAQSDPGSTGARSAYDFLASIGHDALSEHLRLDHDLLQRYVDYEEMDDGPPELTSALDIYAECTASGRWPGYADDVVLAELPPWETRELKGEVW